MNSFKNDIRELKEIVKIISACSDKIYDEKLANENFSNLCEDSDDIYLKERSEAYIEAFGKDEEFKKMLGYVDLNNYDELLSLKKYFNSYCNQMRKNSQHEFNFIDLFCGAGGLSLGFVQENFGVNLACDFEEACVETYKFNHIDVDSKYIMCNDIKEIEDDITKYLNNERVDIVIGGPPCQGFSMANRQRIIDDPRNKLYKSYVNVVNQTRPKFFVMENVKGMLGVADQVKADFENINYHVEYRILNAKNYGVPQNRERLIFIGTRLENIDLKEIFNEIEKSNNKSYVLEDAIGDLKMLKASRIKNNTNIINDENGGIVIKTESISSPSEYVNIINNGDGYNNLVTFNHQSRYNNDRDIEIYGRLYEGDRSDDPKIADIMPYKSRNHMFKDKYYKLNRKEVCKTITAHMKFDCNMYIHPTQARGLTPREAARVQSYPDNYIFKGTFTKTYMQIGNSVPPLLGRAIARVIKQYLKEIPYEL